MCGRENQSISATLDIEPVQWSIDSVRMSGRLSERTACVSGGDTVLGVFVSVGLFSHVTRSRNRHQSVYLHLCGKQHALSSTSISGGFCSCNRFPLDIDTLCTGQADHTADSNGLLPFQMR